MLEFVLFQGQHDLMLKHYKQLLSYIKSAVTKNYSEKSINAILDYISTSKQMDLLQKFYETTLDALKVRVLGIWVGYDNIILTMFCGKW